MAARRPFTTSTVKSRPVFGVDLVSNSDRMLLAHRRNTIQTTALAQRLETMDRKCRRSVDRIREDIRHIYFNEQIPREVELRELEAKVRREELLSNGDQGLPKYIPIEQYDAPEEDVFEDNPEPDPNESTGNGDTVSSLPVIRVQYSEKTIRPYSRGQLQSGSSSSNGHQATSTSLLPVPDGQVVKNRIDSSASRTSSTMETGVDPYARRPSTMISSSHWRRPSIVHREGALQYVTSYHSSLHNRGDNFQDDDLDERSKSPPQKSPAEVMAAVRAVYNKSGVAATARQQEAPRFWQKQLPPHLVSARTTLRPPRPPPSKIRSQAKERLDAFLTRLQEKYKDKVVTHVLPGGECDEEEPIDFNEYKWRPYRILLDKHRQYFTFKNRPVCVTKQERSWTTLTSATSMTYKSSTSTGDFGRYYRDRILNDDLRSEDSESLSCVMSRSQSRDSVNSDSLRTASKA